MRIKWIGILALVAMVSGASAATNNWTGGGGDDLWTTAANWDTASVPAGGDVCYITNGATVYTTLGDNYTLPNGGVTLNLIGNSTLEDAKNANKVIRSNGSTFNVEAGSTLGGFFFDLNNSYLTFEDGAFLTATKVENKGACTMRFNLGASGFTTLTPNEAKAAGAVSTAPKREIRSTLIFPFSM